jgi:hypothetical protein
MYLNCQRPTGTGGRRFTWSVSLTNQQCSTHGPIHSWSRIKMYWWIHVWSIILMGQPCSARKAIKLELTSTQHACLRMHASRITRYLARGWNNVPVLYL